jgi:NADPH2:quinone reductase
MAGSVYLTRTGLNAYAATAEERRQRGDDVLRWLAAGELTQRIDRTFALEDAAQAHHASEAAAQSATSCCCRSSERTVER